MMKGIKSFLYIGSVLLSIAIGTTASAETVTQKMARNYAQTFFNTLYGEVTGKPKLVWSGRELTTDHLFTPFYVYNSPKGGFVVISAENKAFPILAYSSKNSFDKGRLDDRERDQFVRFAREIELIRYDTRTPSRAIRSWQQIPDYFTEIIGNPYNTPEYRALTEDAQEELEQMDRRSSAILMPSAVEFEIYNPERFRSYNLDDVTADEVEEIPFSFYEQFLEDIAEEERQRAHIYDERLNPTEPKIQQTGAGTYMISLPDDNARLMRVYSLDGLRKIERYYQSTPQMAVDLSGLGSGYYVVMALGESGNIYAFKLTR